MVNAVATLPAASGGGPTYGLIKPADAAKLLNIGKGTLWELTNRNIIPHVRVGRCLRYCPVALQAWIDKGGMRARGRPLRGGRK